MLEQSEISEDHPTVAAACTIVEHAFFKKDAKSEEEPLPIPVTAIPLTYVLGWTFASSRLIQREGIYIFRGGCPFCGSNPKALEFFVDTKKSFFSCARCIRQGTGAHVFAYAWLRRSYKHTTMDDARDWLTKQARTRLSKEALRKLETQV